MPQTGIQITQSEGEMLMIYGIAMMKMNKRTASKPNTIEKSQIIKL
jgi:hypothetical protein